MPPTVPIGLNVNGIRHELSVEPRWLLVDVIREALGLTGTHVGCEHGVCGTCTVLLNGETVRSCLMLAVSVDGAEILTVEGLTRSHLHPLQEAFREAQGLQCGFCTPGMLMLALELLRENPVAERPGDPRGHLGQPLPLHRIPGHRRRRPPRRLPQCGRDPQLAATR